MKQDGSPTFFGAVLLVGLLYFLSFLVDAYLISRKGFNAKEARLLSSVLLLAASLLLLRLSSTSDISTQSKFSLAENTGLLIALSVSLVIAEIGVTFLSFSVEDLRGKVECNTSGADAYVILGTCILSPAIETLLFVRILPSLLLRNFKNSRPLIAFLVVAFIFSILHIGRSPLAHILLIINGVVLCYVYFGSGSLPTAFMIHAITNTSFVVLDEQCSRVSGLMLGLNSLAVFSACLLGVSIVFFLIFRLSRTAQSNILTIR